MTKASKGDDRSIAQGQELDNLTVIKGIGAKTESWLRQSLNVRTFRDLAALSADEVESQLKAEGRIVSRNVLDQWIAQAGRTAQELTAIHSPASRGAGFPQVNPSPPLARPDATYQPQSKDRTPEKDWRPFASFVVEFQYRRANGRMEQRTKVHHMEDDKDVAWSGIARDELQGWMLERLPTLAEEIEKQPRKSAAARTVAARPVNLHITGVRLFQRPKTDLPLFAEGRAYPGFIDGAKSFAVETTFDLAGPGAAEAAEDHSGFIARVYAHNLSTSENIYLGDTEPGHLADGTFSYTARLPEASLAPGIYRLDCLASLQEVLVTPGHQRLPRLQVV